MKAINFKCIISILFVIILLFASFKLATRDEVVNYFGLPETIVFNKHTYKLSWSSHPTDSYYKEEYLLKGDKADTFNDMILIDFVQGNFTVKDAVLVQEAKIKERKKTDKICNYQLLSKADNSEFMLDFLMGEQSDNTVNLLEWSAYHYTAYTDKAGHKGVLLFGICHRAYGDETGGFLRSLLDYRHTQMKALNAYTVPEIQVK